MLFACVILAAVCVAVFVYAMQLKGDIRQLGQNLYDIAQTDTNAQLTTHSFDRDIVALAACINRILARNRQDLYEKVRVETALKRAITNISHDLRTPLTAARGYMQMLGTSDLDATTKTQYIETVVGRLAALEVRMNNLFEFAQVVEGRMPLAIQRINMIGVLREALAACYPTLTEKGFSMDFDLPETAVYVMADPEALARVLQNLLRNVVVHGYDHVAVKLTADGELVIGNHVRDTAAIDAPRLFERFYTADASRTNSGTGLGLAIAKELVTRMNGQITAEVLAEDLVLRMRLPLYQEG